jgi:UDP-N-acetylmuramate dehydrogenase
VDKETVRIGSSVPLQRLVRVCIENGLQAMEYLYSVPGNVGGAVYMNAGRGIGFNQSVADHLVSVEVFDGGEVRTIRKEDCRFGYRTSLFQQMRGWFILSVLFRLPPQDRETGEAKVRERMKYVREHHDLAFPNAGTVFRKNFVPLPEIIGHRIGNAAFSSKTPGWIVNLGGASAMDVRGLIRHARKCHRRRGLPAPELEVVVVSKSRWSRLWANVLLGTGPGCKGMTQIGAAPSIEKT